jgi:hypothetical protein
MHSAIHLDTEEPGLLHACQTMTGTAGLIQVLHQAPVSQVITSWYNTFQPTIQEEGLAAYPLYLPILSATSLTGQKFEVLDEWMGKADIYIRESMEDKGILLLSRKSLDEALEKTGFILPEDKTKDASERTNNRLRI